MLRGAILLLLFPVSTYAGNIVIETDKRQGESFYIVESPSQGLKSKLIFPFNIYTGSIGYQTSIEDFAIQFNASYALDKTVTTGEDFDWKHNSLTVYSDSKNSVDHYSQYELTLSKVITQQLNIFSKFTYRKLDFSWQDTVQVDYVKNQTESVDGLSLKYEQDFYQLNLGLSYEAPLAESLSFKLEPSLIYAYVESKDSHILRSFYTKQFAQALGYSVSLRLVKRIDKQANLSLHYAYQTLQGNTVDMDYFNLSDYNYLTYPSSYSFKERQLGIRYLYRF